MAKVEEEYGFAEQPDADADELEEYRGDDLGHLDQGSSSMQEGGEPAQSVALVAANATLLPEETYSRAEGHAGVPFAGSHEDDLGVPFAQQQHKAQSSGPFGGGEADKLGQDADLDAAFLDTGDGWEGDWGGNNL